jgi:hypothetical protein
VKRGGLPARTPVALSRQFGADKNDHENHEGTNTPSYLWRGRSALTFLKSGRNLPLLSIPSRSSLPEHTQRLTAVRRSSTAP